MFEVFYKRSLPPESFETFTECLLLIISMLSMYAQIHKKYPRLRTFQSYLVKMPSFASGVVGWCEGAG